MQAVHALHFVSITVLVLVLVVTGVRVFHLVLELVLSRALEKYISSIINNLLIQVTVTYFIKNFYVQIGRQSPWGDEQERRDGKCVAKR